MSEPVLYELRDGIAQLTFNRPESLNSLDLATVDALKTAAARAVIEGAGALVLTGSGPAFCTGADLSSAAGHRGADGSIDLGTPMRSHFSPCASALMSLPIPLVVAVNGIAADGGVSLALMGDIVIAARSASFRQSFIDIGLAPNLGATWLMPRLIGRARARGLALLGEPIPAATVRAWGLIWEVTNDADLLAHARAIALRLSKLSPEAIRGTRRALDVSARFHFNEQLIVETRIRADLGRAPAFEVAVERLMSSKGDRKPAATGRSQSRVRRRSARGPATGRGLDLIRAASAPLAHLDSNPEEPEHV